MRNTAQSIPAKAFDYTLIDDELALEPEFQIENMDSAQTIAAKVAGSFGFLAYVGSIHEVSEFFENLSRSRDLLNSPLEYRVHPISTGRESVVYVELVSAKLNKDELENIRSQFDSFVVAKGIKRQSEINISSSWIVTEGRRQLIQSYEQSRSRTRDIEIMGLRLNDGVEADLGDNVRFFVSADDDWTTQEEDPNAQHYRRFQLYDAQQRPIADPLNAQAEIGIRERSRTYSIRNAFIVQPNHNFSIRSPNEVSIDYRGLYLFFSQEL